VSGPFGGQGGGSGRLVGHLGGVHGGDQLGQHAPDAGAGADQGEGAEWRSGSDGRMVSTSMRAKTLSAPWMVEAEATTAGRAVAVVLMIAGIAMFGVITATIAASFVEQKAEEDLASRLDQIMERLDRIDAGLRAGEDQHALEHQHRCALGVQQGRRQRPGTRNPVSTIRRKRSWSCRRATGGAFSARCCRQKSASVGGRLPVISATRSCGRILGVCAWPRNANTHPGGSTPPWPPS
jgi:hypothetical protein